MSDVTKQETVEAVLDALMAESRDGSYHDMWQQGVRYAVAEISDALTAAPAPADPFWDSPPGRWDDGDPNDEPFAAPALAVGEPVDDGGQRIVDGLNDVLAYCDGDTSAATLIVKPDIELAWPNVFRVRAHGNWLYFTDHETAYGSAEMHGSIAQPLYAHPSEALAAATEAIKELQAQLADRRFVRCGDECLADDPDPNCALEAEFQAQIAAATERAEKAERERDEARQLADDLAWAEKKRDDYAAMLTAAEADLEKMRRALEPFAKEAEEWADHLPDAGRSLYCVDETNPEQAAFTLGDLRRAREALATSPRLSEPC